MSNEAPMLLVEIGMGLLEDLSVDIAIVCSGDIAGELSGGRD